MRVVHISYSDVLGGASRAAYRVHSALAAEGVDSLMLVRRRGTSDPRVLGLDNGWTGYAQRLRERAEGALAHGVPDRDTSTGLLHTRLSSLVRRLSADLAHVHWVGAGSMSLGDITSLGVPVVATMHDMWLSLGVQHYIDVDGQGAATAASPEHRLIDSLVRRRKENGLGLAALVCPSSWMKNVAAGSPATADVTAVTIPYPMELDVLCPGNQAAARDLLGLPADRPIVLFGADGGTGPPRKGFDLLLAALRSWTGKADVLAVVFGGDAPRSPAGVSLEVRSLGRLEGNKELASAYQAADVVVVPSRLDNLPQVGLEAQCCGVPVVAFDTGGLDDVLEDGVTGLLVPPFEVEGLAGAIARVIDDDELRRSMGHASRRRAEERWNVSAVAHGHMALYQRLLEREGRPG